MTENASRYTQQDLLFHKHRKEHPDVSFAQFRGEQIASRLEAGHDHFSLGRKLRGADGKELEFWTAGSEKTAFYFERMRLKPHHRVVDYGCGSLRTGSHFIRFLNPGCYFGLDVVPDFFRIGQDLIGEDLLREKAPTFRVIGPASVAEAAKFAADFVISTAVCIHVHPDELPQYFANLMQITSKPGARLFMNAAVSRRPVRSRYDSWAWPLRRYRAGLPELRLVQRPPGRESLRAILFSFGLLKTRKEEGEPVWSSNFEFVRAST